MDKKRSRKPPVRPEVARKWLKRYEEDGESPPQIAAADGYDVRTVRKQLEEMRLEREVREAKQVVLRGALEKHYVDLCAFAEKLRSDILSQDIRDSISTVLTNDPMWAALRAHLPRSPLWRAFRRMETISEPLDAAMQRLRDRIRKEARDGTSLDFTEFSKGFGLLDGLTDAIAFRIQTLAQGWKGLEGVTFAEKDTDQGVWVNFGAYSVAQARRDQVASIEEVFKSLMSRSQNWEEAAEVTKLTREIEGMRKILQEELTQIILRRVLPGKCSYCPF